MAGARSQDRYDLRFRSVVRIVIRLWFPAIASFAIPAIRSGGSRSAYELKT